MGFRRLRSIAIAVLLIGNRRRVRGLPTIFQAA